MADEFFHQYLAHGDDDPSQPVLPIPPHVRSSIFPLLRATLEQCLSLP